MVVLSRYYHLITTLYKVDSILSRNPPLALESKFQADRGKLVRTYTNRCTSITSDHLLRIQITVVDLFAVYMSPHVVGQ